MLQPVYVFVIFVLKKNVINMILGRGKKGRPTTRTKKTDLTKKYSATVMTSLKTGTTSQTIEMKPIVKNNA